MANLHRHRISVIESWNRLELFARQMATEVRDISTGFVAFLMLGKALIRRPACHPYIVARFAALIVGVGFDEPLLCGDRVV